jgi:hypothetical protein
LISYLIRSARNLWAVLDTVVIQAECLLVATSGR